MLQEKSLQRSASGTGANINFAGTWVNELGSEMTLVQTGDTLTGEYTSTKSDGGGKTSGFLQGYVDGDLISFIVHWEEYQAITSWVGQLEPGSPKETIKTLWQMTKQVPQGEEWASINSGSDSFVRKQ